MCAIRCGKAALKAEGDVLDLYDLRIANSDELIFYVLDQPQIVLCPGFFSDPTFPPQSGCVSVDQTSNDFEEETDALIESPIYIRILKY